MSLFIWMTALCWADAPEGGAEPAPADEDAAADEVQMPDRSAPPSVQPPLRMDLAEPDIRALRPGLTVQLVPVEGVRKVSIQAVLHRGSHDLIGHPNAVTEAFGEQLAVATQDRDPGALEILQDLHQIELSSWFGHHRGGVYLSCPKDDLALGMELLGEVLREPAFPKADLKRSQRFQKLFYTVDGPSNLGWAARYALSYGWYPADHPYGQRPDVDAIEKVRSKDLYTLHERWLETSPVTVLVVGDVGWDEVSPHLEAALEGLGAEGTQEPDLAIETPTGVRAIGIEGPGDAQARIVMRMAAPFRGAADRLAADRTVWALGGHFLSRLNRNLREDKGFTYGSSARYFTDDTRGAVTVAVDVKVENVEATVTEIRNEIDALIADGVAEAELDAAALAEISQWNGVRESSQTARSFYASLLRDGETVADVRARGEAGIDLSVEDTRALAETYFSPDATRLWVIAGDPEALAPQLEALGLEVDWISPEDAMLGTF